MESVTIVCTDGTETVDKSLLEDAKAILDYNQLFPHQELKFSGTVEVIRSYLKVKKRKREEEQAVSLAYQVGDKRLTRYLGQFATEPVWLNHNIFYEFVRESCPVVHKLGEEQGVRKGVPRWERDRNRIWFWADTVVEPEAAPKEPKLRRCCGGKCLKAMASDNCNKLLIDYGIVYVSYGIYGSLLIVGVFRRRDDKNEEVEISSHEYRRGQSKNWWLDEDNKTVIVLESGEYTVYDFGQLK